MQKYNQIATKQDCLDVLSQNWWATQEKLLLFAKEYIYFFRSTNISVKLNTKLAENIKSKPNS